MTVMPPSDGAPQVVAALSPTDDEIMEVIGLTSVSTEQFCQRLRELFTASFVAADIEGGSVVADLQDEIREINKANGWYDSERPFEADMALLHSEVSEAFEAFRSHGLDDCTPEPLVIVNDEGDRVPALAKPEGVGSELADIFIRLLDTCDRYDFDLLAETRRKMQFNRTRGYRHGGKRV